MLRTGLGFGLASIIAIAAGLQSEAIPFIKNGRLSSSLTFSRNDPKSYIDANGFVKTVAANVPALDYSRGYAAYSHHGFAVTNKFLQSERLDNVIWSKTSGGNTVTVTGNQVLSPDGVNDTAELLSSGTSTGLHEVSQTIAQGANGVTPVSIFMKRGTTDYGYIRTTDLTSGGHSATFNLVTGEVNIITSGAGTSTDPVAYMDELANGWWRCVLVQDFNSGTNVGVGFGVTNSATSTSSTLTNDTIYLWGAQGESGQFATPYIATTNATVEREADVLSLTGSDFTAIYNSAEGVIYTEVEKERPVELPEMVIASFDDGGGFDNYIWLAYYGGDGTRSRVRVADGGVLQASIGTDDSLPYPNKFAFRYEADNFAISGDAADVSTDTSGSLPTVDRLTIGAYGSSSQNPFSGYIRNLRYYNFGLTDTQLEELTTPDYVYIMDGDSYVAGSGGVSLGDSFTSNGFRVRNSAVGGSTLSQQETRILANPFRGTVPLIHWDGDPNGNSGVVATEIAKYQDIYDACNGNVVFCTPMLYSDAAGTTDGQFILDLGAAMITEFGAGKVVDTTALARIESGATFTDPTDADDAGYATTAYDALFQTDNVHLEQPLMTVVYNKVLLRFIPLLFNFTDNTQFDFTNELDYNYN